MGTASVELKVTPNDLNSPGHENVLESVSSFLSVRCYSGVTTLQHTHTHT